MSPALPAGKVSVELTSNNVDFTSDSIQFEYKMKSEVSSISPNFGSIDGGTRVMVKGRYFQKLNLALPLWPCRRARARKLGGFHSD